MSNQLKKIHEFIATRIHPIELALLVKFILQVKRKTVFINNFFWQLDPISDFGIRLLTDGIYEAELTTLLLNTLTEGDVFIDLGANEGYFSILASKKVGKNGSVYSIEPQSRLWEVILINSNKNNCYNISLLPFAISNKVEEVEITLSPSINTGSSGLVNEKRKSFWKKQKMNSTTLDNLFDVSTIPIIKLIKIDIEGFELFALLGAQNLLKSKRIKNLIVEVHPNQLAALGQSLQQINELLTSYGYLERDGMFSCE